MEVIIIITIAREALFKRVINGNDNNNNNNVKTMKLIPKKNIQTIVMITEVLILMTPSR